MTFAARDGTCLRGHLWRPVGPGPERGTAVIMPATGVLARYYHRFATFLSEHGFTVLTFDYRGIGLSRPRRLRALQASWRLWGEQDVDAALSFVRSQGLARPLLAIGHSIGGALIGLAPSAVYLDRIMTVGAQYAYWRDYARAERARLFWRWHIVMPALTAGYGYFPGRRLGWLEDLPRGVAHEWSFKGPRLEARYPVADRPGVLTRFAAIKAPLLALSLTDDEYGTRAAIERTLAYYAGAQRWLAMVPPEALGEAAVGHFAPFHARLRDSLWQDMLAWLMGQNELPHAAAVPFGSHTRS